MEPQHPFFYKGYTRALLSLLIIAGIFALVTYANLTLREARYLNTGPTTINVIGEGEILAVPDIGQFSFSVMAEGENANTAQEQSAESINTILEYLKGEGVEDVDIKTTNYNLYPKYRYEERVCSGLGYCPPGERVMDGFEVSQTISVKVRQTDQAGTLISGVGERGATNISGLNFTIDDEEGLQAEARAKAIADAKEKARELAADLNVRLVRMVGYWEDQGGYPQPYYGMGGDMAVEEASFKSAPQVPTGENSVVSRVNITYEVQ